jgi:hypothetical protein
MNRKGLGIGKGSGYYNIAPMDSHIHSLSAKGVKSRYVVYHGLDGMGAWAIQTKHGNMTDGYFDSEKKARAYAKQQGYKVLSAKKTNFSKRYDRAFRCSNCGFETYDDNRCPVCGQILLFAKGVAVHNPPKRILMDSDGNEYSANAGDYWNMKPEDELKDLVLMEDGQVVNEHPKKKDLVDEIYQAQDWQTSTLKKRKPVAQKKLFRISTSQGDYIVNNKGLITQDYNYMQKGNKGFSGQWALEGASNMYGRKIADWDELLKTPDKFLKTRGGLFVIDLDNGTTRVWASQKVKSVSDASYLLKHKPTKGN